MKIVKVVEKTVPFGTKIANAYVNFSSITGSVVESSPMSSAAESRSSVTALIPSAVMRRRASFGIG
jgi:hypothetical protein